MVCEGRFAGCSTVWERGPRAFVRVWPKKLPGNDPPSLSREAKSVEAHPEAQPEAASPEPNGNSERQGPEGAGPSPPPPTAGPLPVAVADDMRGQVFEWLHDSFDSLRSQLRVLSDAVSRQQRALDSMTEAGAAAERLSRLADVLPDRIGEAVYEAIAPRGAASDNGAGTGDGSDGSGRGTEDMGLGDAIGSSVGDPGPTHGRQPLASTARPPINRSGWQDRLLALRPAGSQSGG